MTKLTKNILYIDSTEYGKITFVLLQKDNLPSHKTSADDPRRNKLKRIEKTFAVKPHESPMILGYLDRFLSSLKIKDEGLRIKTIVVLKGGGSFTGLRIAAAVAEGLSLAWGVPVKYKNK